MQNMDPGGKRADWPLAGLGLRVRDLDRQVDFYQRLGMQLLVREPDRAVMGAGGRPLLSLIAGPDLYFRPPGTAGLFHFAILLPGEAALGGFLKHASSAELPVTGWADHLVSQAIYLDDPEGNGIEVYADRPREQWHWVGDRVEMATLPIDAARLLAQADPAYDRFPPGTLLGHMHLTVADLDAAQAFYEGLGMRLVSELGPIFRFMAWGRYHHHLGLNLVNGRGAAPVSREVTGLDWFEVAGRPEVTEELSDPDQVRVRPAR